MARNRNDRTSTAGDVVERLSSFLRTTVNRPELDAIPIILQRAAPLKSPTGVVEPDFCVPVGSETLLTAETPTNAGRDSLPSSLQSGGSKRTVVTAYSVLYWVLGGVCLLVAAAIAYKLM